MLNEKKIKLMTNIAIFEKNEAKDIQIASTNFKVDYVTLHMLYTAIYTTIAYIIMIALYVMTHMEELFLDLSATDFPALISLAVKNYLYMLFAFLAIALVYYTYRYSVAFKKIKKDYVDLKSLAKMSENRR